MMEILVLCQKQKPFIDKLFNYIETEHHVIEIPVRNQNLFNWIFSKTFLHDDDVFSVNQRVVSCWIK